MGYQRLSVCEKDAWTKAYAAGTDISYSDGKAFARECINNGYIQIDSWICENCNHAWVRGYVEVYTAYFSARNAGLVGDNTLPETKG